MFWKKNKDTLDQIIAGCINNQRADQEKMYKLFFQDMYLYCRQWLQDEDIIITVINDSFLKIFINLTNLKTTDSFHAWIKTIVRNTLYDHFRKKKPEVWLEEESAINLADNHVELNEPFFEREFLGWLESLPETTREVFRMYALEGYNHADIAEKYNITESTSRWHVSHARKILQKKWIESN